MNNSRKTLVILTPGFAENEADTTCLPAIQMMIKSINQVAPALNVTVLAFHYPFFTATYQWHNNTVICLGEKTPPRKLRLLWSWGNVWRRLKMLTKTNEVTGMISCFCTEAALVGKYFCSFYNIKHFTWILGQDASASNKLVRFIRPDAESLVAMSDFQVREFYRSHHIRPRHVIPNGINTRSFPEAAGIIDIDIIGVGNLIPLKQYHIFIEVISAVKQYYPGIRVAHCGKGIEAENIKSLVEKLGLQNNVHLYGEVSHQAALELMQRSRILLHTSAYEGFGGVMIEALYAGAQVISFCRPMDADIPNWHIVPDKEAMIRKTLELLQQPLEERVPVLPYDMQDSARAFLQLFGYSEATLSDNLA
ncbi:glycosyltransferase family 4 protein [uncultured Chitinophaga sp.]|jgi:Glycosyltransferase|uniref:glycosyltransferase family 4 protein n=1 Tax=uncultured Chitinophaga sp. TaxID=339340 RepID=UPI00261A6642|nr:glycosyltransferase [uncultured Chitinophaga sp.]